MKPMLNFPTIEAAAAYAESHRPYKRALEGRTSPAEYSMAYGPKACAAVTDGWLAISTGDTTALLKSMRALSWALPPSVFEYRSKS